MRRSCIQHATHSCGYVCAPLPPFLPCSIPLITARSLFDFRQWCAKDRRRGWEGTRGAGLRRRRRENPAVVSLLVNALGE